MPGTLGGKGDAMRPLRRTSIPAGRSRLNCDQRRLFFAGYAASVSGSLSVHVFTPSGFAPFPIAWSTSCAISSCRASSNRTCRYARTPWPPNCASARFRYARTLAATHKLLPLRPSTHALLTAWTNRRDAKVRKLIASHLEHTLAVCAACCRRARQRPPTVGKKQSRK